MDVEHGHQHYVRLYDQSTLPAAHPSSLGLTTAGCGGWTGRVLSVGSLGTVHYTYRGRMVQKLGFALHLSWSNGFG